MLIARWRIDARFGRKAAVVDRLRFWSREIAPEIGWQPESGTLLSGSIGAAEATVEHNWRIADLAELGRAWEALAGLEAHRAWGASLEPDVVSGSARWDVLRVL